jgi:threonine aldolase
MMKIIDLRSDTVTAPTSEMRDAMAKAEVGDDVFGEDPSINRLQELAASRMGKEAGLFVSSGTMGNLIAVMANCQRGDEVIMGDLGHTFLFEGGGISALGGVFPHTLKNQPDGSINLEEIQAAIRPDDIHHPVSRMVILENTHNRCGGVVLSEAYMQSVADLCHARRLHLHLDGARIFNAAAALGVDASRLVAMADSVTFCLSKGLCAPVGSVLCGSADFVVRARRIRKMLGGGMRQAGILAAAGIVALEKMTSRLGEDHIRASQIASGLAEIPGVCFDLGMPSTNMVFPRIELSVPLSTREIVEKMKERGIKISVTGERRFRLVTHYWVNDDDVSRTISAFSEVLSER